MPLPSVLLSQLVFPDAEKQSCVKEDLRRAGTRALLRADCDASSLQPTVLGPHISLRSGYTSPLCPQLPASPQL